MTDSSFTPPPVFDYVATLAWAASGAVVGIRKRFDIVGVFAMALLSSTGGGLLRDALFLQRTPVLVTDPVYLPLIAGMTVLLSLLTRPLPRVLSLETPRKLVDLIDAVGTPAFAVIGMQLAEDRGIPTFGVVFVGIVNGVGGGLLRDVVVRDVPSLLRPGQFVTLFLLLSCGLFLVLTRYCGIGSTGAGWATIAAFVVIRVLAIRFNWETQPVVREPPVRQTDGTADRSS